MSLKERPGVIGPDKGLVTSLHHLFADNGDIARKMQDKILAHLFGDDWMMIREAWWHASVDSSSYYYSSPKVEALNIAMALDLERRRPGLCQILHRNFRIRNFARYPIEVLVHQHDERDNVERPYGVVIFPYRDWNGSSYGNEEIFRGLTLSLRGHYFLRIFECRTKWEVLAALRSLDWLYGPRHKISFAIIGGHGDKDGIDFGGDSELLVDDLRAGYGRAFRSFFEPGATIVLDSCRAGNLGGIGQEVSRLGFRTIAPVGKTMARRIGAVLEKDGRLGTLEVSFRRRHARRVFLDGRRIE